MRIDANLVEGILCAKIRHDEERHLPQAVGCCEIHLNLRDRASIRSRLNHGDYLGSGRIEDSHEFGSKIPNAGNAFIASVRRIHGARHAAEQLFFMKQCCRGIAVGRACCTNQPKLGIAFINVVPAIFVHARQRTLFNNIQI